MSNLIEIHVIVNSQLNKVWEYFTKENHIVNWNAASEDWHTTKAVNDLRNNGSFSYRMEAKDKSFGFDFSGVYNTVEYLHKIEYNLDDGREVKIIFEELEGGIKITESFEPENENPIELQKFGWQAILNKFKKYTEEH